MMTSLFGAVGNTEVGPLALLRLTALAARGDRYSQKALATCPRDLDSIARSLRMYALTMTCDKKTSVDGSHARLMLSLVCLAGCVVLSPYKILAHHGGPTNGRQLQLSISWSKASETAATCLK